MENTGGVDGSNPEQFFWLFLREKVDMSCHVVPLGEKSLDR